MRIIFRNTGSNQIPTLFRIFISVILLGSILANDNLPNVQAQAGAPQLILTKSIEGNVTTAQVGDVIRYRIRFECSSLTTSCGVMEITDVLQAGLTYLPPPNSSVPSGFTITESAPIPGTITITKDDDNLLDGSQYDAVIAVRVDYNLRPLPATINNTIGGRIDPPGPVGWQNATPANAPPITIGTVTPSWAITKSLISPTINPTVNTDVTYQIQLCPTTPPPGQGNVPLRNIILTDNLPAGATFVSASNGGTDLAGVVTWPLIIGPIYPPNCVSRFVTIRYNSPPFNIGNNVTNTASGNGEYTNSIGGIIGPYGVGPTPITHPIDPIAEIPTYSKNDVGDPVGFTGTGRFVLDLNTNNTNYPSNELVLVDNLPPELQVTGVTSGGWDASFDYVRAFVEYSTNNGGSYTSFPGQPITYNTLGTYVASATNITNVRWRFEYDPDGAAPFSFTSQGLPYTWSFTTSPEIRVTPRAAAVDTDPPVVSLPAAVAGATYNNCLQVTRRNSSNTPVTDACDNEPMTVQGDLVSLRVSKGETQGASWDDLDDPLINTFIADSNLLPGDTLRYTLTVEVTERSSTPLIDPTIRDTLPTDLIWVRNGTARLDGTALATQPVFTQSGPNPGVNNQLIWDFSGLTVNPLPLGSHYLTVEFFARIPRGQTPGTRTNDMYVVTDSVDVFCENGTPLNDSANGDVDGDNDPTDPACQVPDTYVVERSAALRGEKWIRSTDLLNNVPVDSTTFLPPTPACPTGGTTGLPTGGSNPFTRYPCIAQAFPEGMLSPGQLVPPPSSTTLDDFEYNLRIFNDGNVDMLSYFLYDILPYYGDKGSGGTLSSSSRLSEFRPVMRGPVEFISGPGTLTSSNFTIEYNDTTNPCRPEVFNQPTGAIEPAGCNNTWTTVWSASARSYRIRLIPPAVIQPAVAPGSELRFGVPMYIPADSPTLGVFNNDDAQSLEIAWNSFSHVGSYDAGGGVVRDLLASEPRKVGITIPERMSVGNRVWRDSDNSGTINPPDDTTPGIANVVVNLYRDTDDNGIADGAAIATTLTDTGGYYLFSNIPYDATDMNNNRYIIGIPAANFNAGQPLVNLRSSTGTPSVPAYTNPPSSNGDNNDNGRDPVTPGLEVFSASFILQPSTEPTAELDLSSNNRDGPAGMRRGLNAERDENSDLTLDFGFFGGTDIPFSIGNHVWFDNGSGVGSVLNDGIRQANEPPVAGVDVRLYRDGNYNGIPEAVEMIRTDITDANGFYLFDNLDPGNYYVEIPATEFGSGQPLAGWYSSQTTGTENTGVAGNPNTPNMDSDDNGIDTDFPETNGVFSGVVILTRGVDEQTGESHLSGETDPGSPANQGYSPTGWDGPLSRGRFGESDVTSNLTIDFGFIPPMSLGNRVWFDEGAGTLPFRTGYDNGLQDGTEVGVGSVRVELWRDTNGTPGLQVTGGTPDTFIRFTTTDSSGYYLFDRLQPGSDYFVHIPATNFTAGNPLQNYVSSTDGYQTTPPADDNEDIEDNGIDSATPATTGITSSQIVMAYDTEPLTPTNESDINNSGTYGPQNRGLFGQGDGNSNLTIDFGFVRPPRSIGNRLWFDVNNNGQVDAGEPSVPTGVRVSLYLDANTDGQPDDLGVAGDRTDDSIAFDTTDVNGYYLFDKLPPANYIVGVDRANFATGSLVGYTSSSGNVDNASNNTDDRDNGVDRLQPEDSTLSPHGILSTRINLTVSPLNAPTGEVGSGDTGVTAGFNPTAGDGPNSRGRFGETDANSDLTIDFGFFRPMSLGNRVFLDDGTGGGTYNNGIMDGGELPIANVRVELYRDVDTNGVPDAGLVAFDTTDSNGFYLFDRLAEGNYIVLLPASNFDLSIPTAPLRGLNSSIPTATENTGMTGNPYTPNTDRDDNGINNGRPDLNGILSGTIVLTLDTEPTGEVELSAQANPGAPTNDDFNPTGWDGPNSRGRWSESDINSNLTIDFGFIPVFSLGNRVWFDTDNNSAINGAEVGVNGVRVQLFESDGTTEILVGPDGVLGTADDASGGMLTANGGHYRFNNLLAGDYIVSIPSSNFGAGAVLEGYWSSATTRNADGSITEATADLANTDTDSNDNGTRQPGGEVVSSVVTLGPAITSEPAGETDLGPGGQGQPDTQANMTVDFGFYTIQIGDLVWNDTNNNGVVNAGEPGLSVVDVQLWSADGTTLLQTVTTNASGIYSLTGLPQGNYIVRIPASEFNPGGTLRDYISSTGTPGPFPFPFEPAPNAETNTTNSDDNGTAVSILPAGPDGTKNSSLGLGAYVQSSVFTLTPAAEDSVNNALGLTSEPRIDFGLYTSRQTDLAITKDDGVSIYIAGQVLNYTIVVTNNGPSDIVNAQVDDALPPQIASWVWTCAVTNPATSNCTGAASNSAAFQDFIDLLQGESITYNVAATVSATPSGVLTNTVTVAPPAGVAELNNLNNTDSDSDDFASLQVTKDDGLSIVSAGNTITYQMVVTNNGLVNLTAITVSDTLPADLTYVSANPAPTTQVGNALTWSGLSLTAGSSTTISVTATIIAAPSTTITNVVNVVDANTNANATARDVDSTASAPNFDITKALVAPDDASHTVPPQVTIGEILTYEVVLTMPVGFMTNGIVVDTLQAGLAFVDFESLIVSNPDTDGVANPADVGLFSSVMTFNSGTGACTNCVDGTLGTNPLIEPDGSKITFSFGTFTNTGTVAETITIRYSVVVLDILSNQFILGTTLRNDVVWSWDGNNSIRPTNVPSVNVVEPQLAIDKSAEPRPARLGTPIVFTIDLSHAPVSSANAFDVVVTDVLPPGLAFIPGTFVFTRTAGTLLQPPTFTYNSATTTLTFVWDEFQLGQGARLDFQATFVGPSPVQNVANAQWTSLEIDPTPPATTPSQRSPYNGNSTERWYDPLAGAGLDDYGVSDSVSIREPQGLPRTGFAPGVVTQLPAMPANISYAQTSLMLEVPRLGIKSDIVGIPYGGENWDLTWLSNNAGWLDGSAFPTHAGNSAITAHAYLADGTAGPFVKLGSLRYGDQIIIHLDGQKYIFEVRQNLRVRPNTTSVLKHEELPWLTLITCQTYNERLDDYLYRIAVRAVLVKIE